MRPYSDFRQSAGAPMEVSLNELVDESLGSVAVENPIALHVVAWYSISIDLEAIAAVAERLVRETENPRDGVVDRMLCDSLTWHLVVRYGACFAETYGRRVKLELRDVEDLGDKDMLTLHRGMIDRRNESFAHAGKLCRYRLIVHLMADEPDGPKFWATPSIDMPGRIADTEQCSLIAALCRKLSVVARQKCERKADLLQKKFTSGEIEVLTVLRANKGRHASAEQFAHSMMRRLATLNGWKD